MLTDHAAAQIVMLKGAAGASLSRPIGNEYLADQHIEAGYGYFAEGGIRYDVCSKLSLEAGLLYSVNPYTVTSTRQSAIQTNYRDIFLELPVLLSYRAFTVFRTDLDVIAGLYGNYWLKSKSTGLYANIFDNQWNPDNETEVIGLEQFATDIPLDEGFNRFSLGFAAGIGARRSVSTRVQLGLRAMLRQDLTNRLNEPYDRRYQRFSLDASVFYQLTSKVHGL